MNSGDKFDYQIQIDCNSILKMSRFFREDYVSKEQMKCIGQKLLLYALQWFIY